MAATVMVLYREKWMVAGLLLIQAALLAYSATRHSPTHLEPAFLASGLSHWNFGRFELYRVNPPLPRMIAALPVSFSDYKMDWSGYVDGPGSRSEFDMGRAFIKSNGTASMSLFVLARWAGIPFSLLGAFFAYRWASDLYGNTSGIATLILFVFEPTLLAHGELITPDSSCTAFGIIAGYAFWRWLKCPGWSTALIAGASLGLAQLSKFTWIILFALWPAMWLVWRWEALRSCGMTQRSAAEASTPLTLPTAPPATQLGVILIFAIYLINLGYAYDGVGTQLKEYAFVSRALQSITSHALSEDNSRGSWLGSLTVPLPKQYLLGIDSQLKDLEHYNQRSYLRGEWKQGGWWYYYLYGLLVKLPCGTLGLLALILICRIFRHRHTTAFRDEMVLMIPPLVLVAFVSSQTEFNIHLRYVLPAVGLLLIFAGQSACLRDTQGRAKIFLASLLLVYSVVSSLTAYPNQLSYFNDFVGGSQHGYRHLLGSSYDWGQDWLSIAAELKPGETTFVIETSPTEYAPMFPSFTPISLEHFCASGSESTAIVPRTEPILAALAANKLILVRNKFTLMEVKLPLVASADGHRGKDGK